MRLALLANPDNIHVQRWVKFLAGRGHELLLVADPHTRNRPKGIRVEIPTWNILTNVLAFRLTPAPHGNSLWKAIHYRPIIARFRPDVVHGFEAYYNGLATAWAGPYPKVLTPWGMDIHRDAVSGGLAAWMVRQALRGVDRITTNDDTLPDYLSKRFGIPAERVEPFSWGVDLKVFRSGLDGEGAVWRERLKIPNGAPVILSPRNLDPYWGAETVIESLPQILRDSPTTVAVILASAGEAGFREQLKERAKTLGVAGSIRWVEDWLQPEQMAALFNLAAAFVSIPKTDLLALTGLEGMASGCVPVVANLPAYARHIRPGVNAAVIDHVTPKALAEAVTMVLRDDQFRRSARDYNIELMRREEDASVNMAKIEKVYAGAIESFRGKR